MINGNDTLYRTEDKGKDGFKLLVILIVITLIASFSLIYIFNNAEDDGEDDRYHFRRQVTLADVEELRGLERLRDVSVIYMDRRELERRYDDVDTFFTYEERILFDVLFLFPMDDDLDALFRESYTQDVGGFYRTGRYEVVILDDTGIVLSDVILVHELTHALQDQHFDLMEYRDATCADTHLTRQAVYEGDATFTMYEYLFELPNKYFERYVLELSILPDSDIELPYGVESYLYFPYDEGMFFVWDIYDLGGWEAVNRLYTDRIPASTEQILHVNKYLEGEEPLEISWTPYVEGMELTSDFTVGEFMIYTMLDHYIHSPVARRASSGWGGDRLFYFENGSDFLSIFTIEWDTRDDAEDFFYTHINWQENVTGGFEERFDSGTYEISLDGNNTTIYYSNMDSLPAIDP